MAFSIKETVVDLYKMLRIKNLGVCTKEKELLINDVSLELSPGRTVCIMGPNGSGKSTLANTIIGNPNYEIVEGSMELDEKSIHQLNVTERAKLGIFLAMQNPITIPGITVINFLKASYNAIYGEIPDMRSWIKEVKKIFNLLGIDESFLIHRYVNDEFSGGEKKRFEIAQLVILKSRYVILDEIDSGLDVDGLRTICHLLKDMKSQISLCIITHYSKIFDHIDVDEVHIFNEGRFIRSGGMELVQLIDKKGYASLLQNDA
jgi:Fe-S cluster assembly ATP-binding protein